MKKLIFIIVIITVFPWNTVIAQWEVQPAIGISHNWSLFGIYKTDKVASITNYHYNSSYYVTSVPYQITNINGGINLVHQDYNLSIRFGYQYFVCKQQVSINFSEKVRETMKGNLIGLIISNKFRETKVVRPFFSIELSTEIGTNYKEKYLGAENYNIDKYITTASYIWNKNINYYQSTPFIGNLLVGCDFRLYKGLSVNAAFGYGLRILKAQYGTLYYYPSVQNKPATEIKIGNPYTLGFNMLTLQLGLSYAFDIHKKKQKTETP